MNLLNSYIKPLMILSGVITCSMLLALFSPETSLNSLFGATVNEPLALAITRSWGFLIFLIGGLLIYGALKPVYRTLALTLATISKLAFVLIVVFFATDYLNKASLSLVFDSVLIVLFSLYLIQNKMSDK